MNMRKQIRNKIKLIFNREEVKNERSVMSNQEIPVNGKPKKVTVKINIDALGRLFLDKDGKEVVMLDSDENYVKKIFTEFEKVQGILSRYYQEE